MRRAGRFGRRGVAVLIAAAVVLVLLGTVAYASVQPTRKEAAQQLQQRNGRIRIKNSLKGQPIVGKLGMAPGDRVSGTVRIGNSSRVRARFYVGLANLTEVQGQVGGRLSFRLVLTVKRLFGGRRPQVVYTGPLRAMPLVKLGKFKPRESRTYRFTVYFPDGGTSDIDGRFQDASVSLDFKWYARRAR